MNQRRNEVKISIILILLLLGQTAFGLDVSKLRLAVIWNEYTTNDQVPIGWNVGNAEGDAPEIGKAQLKLFLASIDKDIAVNGTLDTVGVPDSKIDSSDILGSTKLRNVRIYNHDNTLTLDNISKDFGDKYPHAIVYINAGAVWGDAALFSLLNDAATHDIGIMTIGDASVTDAKNIDTTKTVFPIMGVQKDFRFKAYNNDTIREFDFMTTNNTAEWLKSDTVVLRGDDTKIAIVRVSTGDTIYAANLAGSKLSTVTKNNLIAGVEVLHAYGEWSIKAKAVEVIDNDLYAPEMTTGIFNNHDVILLTKNNSVYVAKATWGSKLTANGTIIADRGIELPGVTSYGSMSGSNFVFTKDYIVTTPNIDDGSKTDSILIITKGKVIGPVTIDNADELEFSDNSENHYIGTYLSGGYKDLKIRLMNTTDSIFKDVFPTLKSNNVTELKFKPWTVGGRIQSAADIWAINEKLKTSKFDSVYVNNIFDSATYYTAYLGDQVAGAAGSPHFVKAPETLADFDKGADQMRSDSLGYDQTGKLYHTISAVQKGHRRLVMLGFQPTYLDNQSHTKDLLQDATIWIGSDDYKLPTPQITAIHTLASGDTIPTTLDSVRIIVDFENKGDRVKKANYKVHYTVTYGATTKTDSVALAGNIAKVQDTLFVDLSTAGIVVDPSNRATTQISVKATSKPASTPSFFDRSDEATSTLLIRKLKNPVSGNKALSVNSKDTLTVSMDTFSKAVSGTVTIMASKNNGAETSGDSPFELTGLADKDSVKFFATASGYINSDTTKRVYLESDITGPTIESKTPADGATNVAMNSNIVLTFNEPVKAGTGNIVLKKDDGTIIATISITDPQVAISGNTVTINPTNDLPSGTAMHVLVGTDAIKDASNNNFAGISSATEWNFSTTDATSPTVTNKTPADNATNVSTNSNLILTFDEPVKAGSGNIVLKKKDGTTITTIAISDPQVVISGNTVTINPTNDLPAGTEMNILIDATALEDISGNDYVGITDPTTWNFTTSVAPDLTAPTLTSVTPVDGSTNVGANSDLVLTFNEAIAKGTGNIVLKNDNGTIISTISINDPQVTISGNTVTINPTNDLPVGTALHILIDAGAIEDGSGNEYAGISSATTWNFTTKANNDPIIDNKIEPDTAIVQKDGSDTIVVDIDTVFTDIDGDVLTFTVKSLDSTLVIGKLDIDNKLVLDVQPNKTGKTKVIVTAKDNKGGEVSDTVDVIINDDPIVDNKIEPDTVIIQKDGGDTIVVDIDTVFTDLDGDVLTYTVKSLDSTLVIGELDKDNQLVLDVQPNKTGKTKVIVTAKDNKGGEVSDTVDVIINDDPVVDTTIAIIIDSVIVKENDTDTVVVDLDDLFTDSDNDSLTYIVISKDSALVIGKLDSNNNLILDIQPDTSGSTIVIVIADDGKGGITADTITVVVIEKDPFTYDNRANFHVGFEINPDMYGFAAVPNPAPAKTNQITFKLQNSESDRAEISVFSSVGTKVEHGSVALDSKGRGEYLWNFERNRAGVESSSFLAIARFYKDGTAVREERTMIGVQK